MNNVMPPPQKKDDESWKKALGVLQIVGAADSFGKKSASNPAPGDNPTPDDSGDEQSAQKEQQGNSEYRADLNMALAKQPNMSMAMKRRYDGGAY